VGREIKKKNSQQLTQESEKNDRKIMQDYYGNQQEIEMESQPN
jgi:hypothetical protein